MVSATVPYFHPNRPLWHPGAPVARAHIEPTLFGSGFVVPTGVRQTSPSSALRSLPTAHSMDALGDRLPATSAAHTRSPRLEYARHWSHARPAPPPAASVGKGRQICPG